MDDRSSSSDEQDSTHVLTLTDWKNLGSSDAQNHQQSEMAQKLEQKLFHCNTAIQNIDLTRTQSPQEMMATRMWTDQMKITSQRLTSYMNGRADRVAQKEEAVLGDLERVKNDQATLHEQQERLRESWEELHKRADNLSEAERVFANREKELIAAVREKIDEDCQTRKVERQGAHLDMRKAFDTATDAQRAERKQEHLDLRKDFDSLRGLDKVERGGERSDS
jgi:hypothetical protein